jgi:phage gp29-like protein
MSNVAPKYIQMHMDALNKWRTTLNPLRGLSMTRIVSMLEAGERGEYLDLQWLFRFIEKRDATIRGLKRLRLSAIGNCEWTIKTVPEDELPKGATQAQADKQATELRAAYDQIDNLNAAIDHLALAEFRGYSHLAKVYAGKYIDDGIERLEPWDQWFWLRDGLYGEWLLNPDLKHSIHTGESIDTSHWIIREVDDPIDEIALIAYLRKNLSQKDWDGFIEVFGIPAIFLIMPPNVPQDKEEEYQDTAEAIIADARGTLPNGSDIKTAGGDVRGNAPFKDHINYQDSQIVLAGTSGKLTMLNDPTGLGSGQSNAHQDTFDELAEAEAKVIAELFQQSIDAPLLERMFPGQPALAYFYFGKPDSEDISAVLEHDSALAASGRRIATDDLEERTGYTIEDNPSSGSAVDAGGSKANNKNTSYIYSPARVSNRSATAVEAEDKLIENARMVMAEAAANDMLPVTKRLGDILDNSPDETLAADLQRFLETELPELAKEVMANPQTADALDGTITAGIINGNIEAYAGKKVGNE